MKYCCDMMEFFVTNKEDHVIHYSKIFDEYGIAIHDSGTSYIKIEYCPWCGTKLPESKRSLWFDEMKKNGIDNPLEIEIPKKYQSDEWWKK